ncbi:eCIS core domain-containing protein [Thalassococcus sp. BH17M4-6]|uniref:eCIS core domain-containing protein n=1 Tax=Thalassococcus sp. BH17M4-6 TaxID=3413148 RepID=UPI003BDDB761
MKETKPAASMDIPRVMPPRVPHPAGPLQRRLADSPRLQGLHALQRKADAAHGGLPQSLAHGIEQLSGVSMAGVRVHRNSAEPAKVGALAYAQGRTIHLGPGQDRHLPHEAWHVAQQAQGRVKPTLQSKGVAINDDPALESEADTMGAKAAQFRVSAATPALTAGGQRAPAQMIGLRAYPALALPAGAQAAGLQTVSMPAGDYAHWGAALQRRGIPHGAVPSGDRMIVTQYAGAVTQAFGLPSLRQATSLLLFAEALATMGAAIAAFSFSGGVAWFPALLGGLSGLAKFLRAIVTWPSTTEEGTERPAAGWKIIAMDTLRGVEGGLALWGALSLSDPAAIKKLPLIVYAAIKLVRSAIQALTDFLKWNDSWAGARTFLSFLAAFLQLLEGAALMVAGIGGIEAATATSETLGGAISTGIGVSKGVRAGLQTGAAVKDMRAANPERQPLIADHGGYEADVESGGESGSFQFKRAPVVQMAGVMQLQDRDTFLRNLAAYSPDTYRALFRQRTEAEGYAIVDEYLSGYDKGIPGHASGSRGGRMNAATKAGIDRFVAWLAGRGGDDDGGGGKGGKGGKRGGGKRGGGGGGGTSGAVPVQGKAAPGGSVRSQSTRDPPMKVFGHNGLQSGKIVPRAPLQRLEIGAADDGSLLQMVEDIVRAAETADAITRGGGPSAPLSAQSPLIAKALAIAKGDDAVAKAGLRRMLEQEVSDAPPVTVAGTGATTEVAQRVSGPVIAGGVVALAGFAYLAKLTYDYLRDRREDQMLAQHFLSGNLAATPIPAELNAGVAAAVGNAAKAAQIFENVNNFRFRYIGNFVGPRAAFATHQGDCQTLVGLYQEVALFNAVPFAVGSSNQRQLVAPLPIHGRNTTSNTEEGSAWYFQSHTWAIGNGTAYDVLFMLSPPPPVVLAVGSAVHNNVTYYIFADGRCVIEPGQAHLGVPILREGRVFPTAMATQAFINAHP